MRLTALPGLLRLGRATAILPKLRGLPGADLAAMLRQTLPGRPGGRVAPPPLPEGARFLSEAFSSPAGARPYRLYVPSTLGCQRRSIVVMLHGCTQTPEDFARGTRMNAAAEAVGALVVYPEQIAAANPSRCWNWFDEAHQARHSGEPAIVAGIVGEVARRFSVADGRAAVAGLSAGGALAAILGHACPDLFAAVGVHSGLACGSACDLPTALAAMRSGPRGTGRRGVRVPAIVFHGDRDGTVHPSNGEAIVDGAGAGRRSERAGQVIGGHRYTVTTQADASGRTVLESWRVHGAAHAWSGGDPAGSFTDPVGPDATREMMRFFAAALG